MYVGFIIISLGGGGVGPNGIPTLTIAWYPRGNAVFDTRIIQSIEFHTKSEKLSHKLLIEGNVTEADEDSWGEPEEWAMDDWTGSRVLYINI